MPAHDVLRPPEIGTVMVRGRAGATGAPFNLGEMTVTRATVRLAERRGRPRPCAGARQGRRACRRPDRRALRGGRGGGAGGGHPAPLRAEAEAAKPSRAAKAAATKVEFFTMVRGEN
jgi:alpha-D-ribose 1-methylphosphonate 5-triphosphate synthase subunit PhnG